MGAHTSLAPIWERFAMDATVETTNPFAVIEAKGSINKDDVLALRRLVWDDGRITELEAEAIFRADQVCRAKARGWKEFYVDALTDFFVWKSDPPKYVSEPAGEFLIRHILRDNKIAGICELELLVNITYWAVDCPVQLHMLVLEAVRDSVLTPEERLYGWGRKPGVITRPDVEIVRRAIYAQGSEGGFTVTRTEAELIFELEHATDGEANHESWQDLYVKAIANFLMFPRGARVVPSAAEQKRRDAWLEERRGVGELLKQAGKNSFRLSKIKEGWDSMDTFGRGEKREREERERAQLREALGRESIDEAEARWLLSKIGEDGKVTENERALLRFIRDNAPYIDPQLAEFIEKIKL
jgi:hypothetical protein